MAFTMYPIHHHFNSLMKLYICNNMHNHQQLKLIHGQIVTIHSLEPTNTPSPTSWISSRLPKSWPTHQAMISRILSTGFLNPDQFAFSCYKRNEHTYSNYHRFQSASTHYWIEKQTLYRDLFISLYSKYKFKGRGVTISSSYYIK